MMVTDFGRIIGLKRPVSIETGGYKSEYFFTGGGGHIDTEERTPQDFAYHLSQEGHTGTGGQAKWVLVKGCAEAAGKAGLVGTMRTVKGIMATELFGDPWSHAPQTTRAARGGGIDARRGRQCHSLHLSATASGSPCGGEGPNGCTCHPRIYGWMMSRRRPLGTTLAMMLTTFDMSSECTSWNTPLLRPHLPRRRAVAIVETAATRDKHSPMKAPERTRTAAA